MSDVVEKGAYCLALTSIDGLGPRRIRTLITRFCSVEKVFEASIYQIASLPGLNPLLAERILQAKERLFFFQRRIDHLKNRGIEVWHTSDERYPAQLKQIKDSPPILCKKGGLEEISDDTVAIVGTRTPTKRGMEAAGKIAAMLAKEGLLIVSGLARGIDTQAHLGALQAKGKTVGVLGCDLERFYPPENRELADLLCVNGALISEHPFYAQPTPANLIRRNRIISGLSKGIIVVEAEEDGGAMQAAKFAQKQERQVFAYRWASENRLTRGPNRLIADGALGIETSNVSDIIFALRKVGGGVKKKGEQLNFF